MQKILKTQKSLKMKNTKILILIISLMVIFSSCSSDDDDIQSAVGAWNLTGFSGTSTTVVTYNVDNAPTITTVNTQSMISSDSTITFNEDNTYVANGSLQIHSVTTTNNTPNGDTTYTSTPPENGTWSINGNQITVTTNGTESTGTITEFTDHILTIKHVIHTSIDNAAGNSTTDSEFYQTYTR